MLFRIQFKKFGGSGIKSPADHPLLDKKKFSVKIINKDSKINYVEVTNNIFNIPDLIKISTIEFRFWSVLNLTGKEFITINIIQQFSVQHNPDTSVLSGFEPTLKPTIWLSKDKDLSHLNHGHMHMGKHPLLDYDDRNHEITLNCLVINLTDFWMETHKENRRYKVHNLLSTKYKVRLMVFAHLYGPPLIWYVCVPEHLLFKNNLSPHIFFSPDDNAETQFPYGNNPQEYGKKDMEYINAGVRKKFIDDGYFVMRYLLPPVDDVDVDKWRSTLSSLYGDVSPVENFRNVIITKGVTYPKFGFFNKPQPNIWNICIGLEKAFAGSDKQPNQLLLMPQRPLHGNNVFATNSHLQNIVEGIMNMLWTNDEVINQDSSINNLLTIDKFVSSCFSESGVDLWIASMKNMNKIKAVIAVEPEDLNAINHSYGEYKGIDVISKLLEKKIKVYLIGRHHHTSYRPSNVNIVKDIKFKPDDPVKIFEYPPNPDNNDFIRYRVGRIKDIDSDPLMTSTERDHLKKSLTKLKSPSDLFKLVFHYRHNVDIEKVNNERVDYDGVDHWYSHQFAFSGGQLMKLPSDYATKGMYNRPVTYKTFFQECVEEIG